MEEKENAGRVVVGAKAAAVEKVAATAKRLKLSTTEVLDWNRQHTAGLTGGSVL